MKDHDDGTGISTAVAELPPDLALIKMENESIQALAAARPRSMVTIKNELTATLDAFPAFAEQLIYAKPVGKDENTGEQKIARGLSIRAAEALAEAYGFNRVRSEVTEMPEERVKVEATFVDFQRGRIWQDAGILSKWYKSRSGSMSRTPDDRFYGVVVKAEASRRIREVINRSVNAGLKAWLWDEACKRTSKLLDEKGVQKILGSFKALGVTLEEIERFLGTPLRSGWTEQHRLDLMGAWQAIHQGEETVESMFRVDVQPAKPAAGPPATGTADALNNSPPTGGTDTHRKSGSRKKKEAAAPPVDAPAEAPAGEESQATPPAAGEESQEAPVHSEFFQQWLTDLEGALTVNRCGQLLQILLASPAKLAAGEMDIGKRTFREKSEELRQK